MPEYERILGEKGISLATAVIWRIVSGIIIIVSGIALLKGLNWGRLLYLSFTPIAAVLSWLLYGFRPTAIIGIIFYLIVLFFLTQPPASTFFRSGASEESNSKE